MLSEKPWRLEPAAMLALGLMAAFSAGFLLGHAVLRVLPANLKVDQSFFLFLISSASLHIPALVLIHGFLKAHGVTWGEFIGLQPGVPARGVRTGLAVGIVVLPVALVLNALSYHLLELLRLQPESQAVVTLIETSFTPGQRVAGGIVAILFAPVVEEIIFRGILYPLLKHRVNTAAAAVTTSLLFAAIHFNLLTVIPLIFLALVLIYIYEKTETLLAPITTHAFFNAANFLLMLNKEELARWWERSNG